MLTPTDIHYLVGLLTSASTPNDVEIELGSRVMDDASEEKRDVDITITWRGTNSEPIAFVGIEVKDHSKPLDVTHVEQLCAKLLDMPEFSRRAIVSASNYTEPARRKAAKKSVELFNLAAWDQSFEEFDHAKFAHDLTITERSLSWLNKPNLVFNPFRPLPEDITPLINPRTSITTLDCKPQGDCQNMEILVQRILVRALDMLKDRDDIVALAQNESKEVRALSTLDNPCMEINGQRFCLEQVLLKGTVKWATQVHRPQFKVLVKDGERTPFIKCAITEFSQGDLIGFTISSTDRTVHMIKIPVSDRNREKIYRQRLR